MPLFNASASLVVLLLAGWAPFWKLLDADMLHTNGAIELLIYGGVFGVRAGAEDDLLMKRLAATGEDVLELVAHQDVQGRRVVNSTEGTLAKLFSILLTYMCVKRHAMFVNCAFRLGYSL